MYLELQPKLSLEHLFGVFHQDSAMISILRGKDHIYEYVNVAYQNLVMERELLGYPFREVFPELAEQGFIEILDYVYTTGNAFSTNGMPAQINNEERFFDLLHYPIKLSDNQIYGIYVQAKDVTKKMLNKRRLRESEENWRKLANYVPSFTWKANTEGEIIFVSEKWRAYSGLGNAELTDDEYFQCIHPMDRFHAKIKWGEAIKNRSFLENEIRCQRFDGTYRWFLMRAEPMVDQSGRVSSWFGSLIDIDERKAAEVEKQKSEAKEKQLFISSEIQRQMLENLFNLIPAMICTFKGPDHKLEFINPAVEKFFGHRQLLGKSAKDALPEVLEQGLIRHLDKIFKTGKSFVGKEIPYAFAKDYSLEPEIFYFNCSFYAMYDEMKNINGILVFACDATEHVKTREMLALKNEHLVRINNDLDNFIYTASHDLRAPVFNLEGLINSLKISLSDEVKKNDEFNSIMKYVSTSIDRFKNTLQELSDISKVQNDIEEVIDYTYLEEVMEEIRFLYRDVIKASEASIEIHWDLKASFSFSRKNFRSIIINLVSNALKYRKPNQKTVIVLTGQKNKNYLLLSVKDNGLGIPKVHLGKVFTMFKRFHDHVEGTGVGLYIVKRMMENSNGKIEVESIEGEGANFKLYFKLINQIDLF
ncbi:PAS domain-containing sensor histidine kinase [Sporocytophaga myxococcoides]|uniref:PAS domain-containing sensor histidine kinase n=1 Tax=Sporocytophaga myxococcoides TaxID=153721 RepID=UPI0006865CB5|nr:PAS domain-containing sensor histidine kinase [Sporocytophaga myxococcoides]